MNWFIGALIVLVFAAATFMAIMVGIWAFIAGMGPL